MFTEQERETILIALHNMKMSTARVNLEHGVADNPDAMLAIMSLTDHIHGIVEKLGVDPAGPWFGRAA